MIEPAPRRRSIRRGRGAPPAVTGKVNHRDLKNPIPPMNVFTDDPISVAGAITLSHAEALAAICAAAPATDAEVGLDAAKGGAELVS